MPCSPAPDVVVAQDMLYPRSHPAPLETCGAVADFNPVSGQLTVWTTSQAPHAHRTLYALIAGLPEHKIRIISPDIGGGFGNKVPIYPGYLCAIVGSMVTGRPVKWMEDRSENLMSTSFARDYHMHGEIAATADGKILGLRARVLADHGAFNGSAQPSKFPAGFFHIFTGSYDLQAAHCEVTGVYTNKAPGGVAYSCSFRITEAVYLVERMVDLLARELGLDPAELRMKNLLRPEQFPYTCPTGWEYDSGDYPRALQVAMDIADYPSCAASRRRSGNAASTWASGSASSPRASARGRASTWTSWAWAWLTAPTCGSTRPARRCSASPARPRARGTRRRSRRSSPRNWACRRTTWRWCTATPTGPRSGSVPTDPGRRRSPARPPRSWPARYASGPGSWPSAMLEVSPGDLEWADGRWQVRGDPEKGRDIAEIAMAAHGALELPEGVEGHLDAETVYNPPNLTFPFGAYICVTDVDPGTGQVQVRRFIAVDDCGVRINPMIVEGQVHGGLADGVGMALMQVIAFDRRAIAWADRSWTTCCRPRWSARPGNSARPSRRRRTIRSAPRASASRPPSARRPPSSTRSSTRSRRSVCGTPTCR